MADRKLSGVPPSPVDHGRKRSPAPQQNVEPEPASPLRTLRTLGGLVGSGSEGGSRPRGRSLGSALISRTRTSRNKRSSSQQEDPEALLDLILESQCQRLEDQRASLSLLPDPEPAALCGACSLDGSGLDGSGLDGSGLDGPGLDQAGLDGSGLDGSGLDGLDFYYMLIQYQSDRMEDQRCSLPDLEEVLGPVPEGQEDFFSLVQRVQSRRMDEQRAFMRHEDQDAQTGSAP